MFSLAVPSKGGKSTANLEATRNCAFCRHRETNTLFNPGTALTRNIQTIVYTIHNTHTKCAHA